MADLLRLEENLGEEYIVDDKTYFLIGQDYQKLFMYKDKNDFSDYELFERDWRKRIPKGYLAGANRLNPNTVTHLYEGDFDNVGKPLCRNGYNGYGAISILRNCVSKKGVCKTCLSRAEKGLKGVEFK